MMRRAVPQLLQHLQRAGASEALEAASASRTYTTLGNFSFASAQDAPTSSLSSSIKLSASTKGKAVEVSVSAGAASARAKYDAATLGKLAAKSIALKDVARVSVLHASFMDYLLQLVAERYAVLAQWPDFTTMYGKDVYHRAHPEDLKAFYAAVDAFHSAYDSLTEFESLNALAMELVPGYIKRRQNIFGPAVGPTSANAAVAQFLIAHAK